MNKTVHDFRVKDITAKDLSLKEFQGKVLLIVNTASECGYTPQYKGLQEIFEKYGPKGFAVLGFPSNDYGAQEPGSNSEIAQFCEMKYRTTFPMFEKGPVKGAQKQAFFKFLTEEANAKLKGEIKWNFEKFLVDKKGALIARFGSDVEPTSSKLTTEIEKLL